MPNIQPSRCGVDRPERKRAIEARPAISTVGNCAIRSGVGYAQVFDKTQLGSGDILYRREVVCALVCTFGIIWLALSGAAIFGPIGLLIAPVIWLLQFLRLERWRSLAHGTLLLIDQVAEIIGISRFLFVRARGRDQAAIFYK